MIDITLCLITKGRYEFLEPLLQSFDRVLSFEGVHVSVILNGVESKISRAYHEWASKHPDTVRIHSFPENDARGSTYWEITKAIKTEWVAFPSDDDVLDEKFFTNWHEFIELSENAGAVACQLTLINYEGKETGVIRKPSYDPKLPLVESAARAFHECPFLWPGLLVRTNTLPTSIPPSRFVSDWLVGLYLMFTTKIVTSDSSFLYYRVHEGQESSAVSFGRKSGEALFHFKNFVQSDIFTLWMSKLSNSEVESYLRSIRKFPPIYGDMQFSSELVTTITNKIIVLKNDVVIFRDAHFTNALAHNLLIDSKQLIFFANENIEIDLPENSVNFYFTLLPSVCAKLNGLSNYSRRDDENYPTLKVGCNHSKFEKDAIRLDCGISSVDLTDQLLISATEYFEFKEVFNTAISPFEYKLVRIWRTFKSKLHPSLNKILFKVLKR